MSPEQYQALLRNNFHTFLKRSFMELNPTTDFADNWHLNVMADELDQCRSGESKRLIVNLPPRSLKSHCASVALPAWILGHNPSAQIICASYAQDLADTHAIDCRALMSSEFYRRLFPATRLSSEKRAVVTFIGFSCVWLLSRRFFAGLGIVALRRTLSTFHTYAFIQTGRSPDWEASEVSD